MLLVAGPFMATIALLIKRDSPGPVFYRREVVGKDGKTFKMYKFRTMDDRNDQSQHLAFMERFIRGKVTNEFYLKEEKRVTKIGAVLREYSLDELPQLWNVLKGEMSLVGPRFCSIEEYRFYKPWHKKRTAVKPGITGIWQVRARSAVSYDDMVTLDIYYIENMSIWLDLELLLRTLPVVFSGKGSRIYSSSGFQNISLKRNLNLTNLPIGSKKVTP
jgi:lipopolysaccharide/colanic/teichoic acid biosynthesis glycosyltransferase